MHWQARRAKTFRPEKRFKLTRRAAIGGLGRYCRSRCWCRNVGLVSLAKDSETCDAPEHGRITGAAIRGLHLTHCLHFPGGESRRIYRHP